MELDENYHHASKRSCVGNGRPPSKIGHKELQHQDEDEEDGEKKKEGGGIAGINSVSNCLLPWQNHPSSRIYRVSRASGGKDRHSKVYTAKGLRDRRVRLSVSTAIQFYDLQDRLGYDQPSKAIEWLIKAAATAIDELPLLDNFLRLPSQHPADEEKPLEANPEDPNYKHQQQQHLSTKSGSSSNSETSKGSVLSLSRTESRVKKRERARERTAKDKEKKRDEGSDPAVASHHQRNLSSNLNNHSSFTELLTASGGNGSNGAIVPSVAATAVESNPNCIPKQISTADYFSQAGLFTQSQKNPQLSSGFSSPSHFGHSAALSMMPFNIAAAAPGEHQEMHQFSFLQDHLIPVSAVAATGDYNLNFSMSSSFAGFNRGTLQSNSPSQLPHHNHQHHHSNQVHLQQRLSTPIDGSSLPFFFGAAAAVANAAENPFPPGFDGRLQLCYNDGFRHSDLKEKRKS